MESEVITKIIKPTEGRGRFDMKLYIMALTNFFMNMGFSYVIPFYPVIAAEKAGLDFTMIGIIMSSNSIGSTIFAYVFGSRIQIWGRKPSLLMSLATQGIVMVLYGTLYFMAPNYWLFLMMSFFVRILQGMSRSVYGIVNYAYLNIFWKDTFSKKFSLMETTSAIGQIVGPLLGSVLNYSFGYYTPLFAQGILYIFIYLLAMVFIPKDEIASKNNTEVRKKAKLPLSQAMSNRSTAITFITLVITRATINYYNSFFTHHMQSYGYDENVAAILISLPQFSYILAIYSIPRLIDSKKHDKFLNSLSLVLSILGSIILSPAWKNNGSITHDWIGLLIIGFGSALNRLPAIPVLVESIIKMGMIHLDQTQLTDMASALFQMNLSLSNLIFPVIGGSLYDIYGGNSNIPQQEFHAFRWTMLTLVIIQMVQFAIDAVFNEGLTAWFTLFNQNKNLNQKSSEEQYCLEEKLITDQTEFKINITPSTRSTEYSKTETLEETELQIQNTLQGEI